MIQKTIILDTMIGGMQWSTDGGEERCKTIEEQVKIILYDNPNYTMASLTDIPTKLINTKKAMLIVDVEEEECWWILHDDGQMGIPDMEYNTLCGRYHIDAEGEGVGGDYCQFCGKKKILK